MEQNTFNILSRLVKFWKRCSYGIVRDGKLTSVPSAQYFQKYYHLLSPQQFKEYLGGICYDYVEFGDYYLKKHNIPFEKFYIYTNTQYEDTHTFIIVPIKDRYVYVEGSFKFLTDNGFGMKVFPTKESIFEFITQNMFFVNDNDCLDEFEYWIWKYTKHPPYGCNSQTFTTFVTQSDPIYEGIAINNNPIVVRLRGATAEDVPNIYKWTLDTIPKKWWNRNTYRLIKRDAWESIHKTDMVVIKGKPIGMVTSYNYTYKNEPGFWYIAEIYLIPEYRGRGIGKAVMQSEIQKHNKLLLQVDKDNTHAIELYKSLGFKTIHETDDSYEMILRKRNNI